MEDLIRRSDVLETYADLYDIFDDNKAIQEELHKVFDKINSIPAVEPSEYADIAYGIGVCQGKASVEPCEDAVSREWMLKEFVAHAYDVIYDINSHEKGMSLTGIRQVIESAPSVTTETDIDDYMKGYDHGTADTWKIAQTVFGSTVTLYEAMDVAKCMKGVEDETY